jgi:hypothetical protein
MADLSSKNYYLELDEMPMANWIKCTNGDLTYVRKGKAGTPANDIIYWDLMYDKYIDTFGLSKYNLRLLEQMKKLALAELDYMITGDRFKLTIIEMETRRLEVMKQSAGTGISLEQGSVHLSKWLGYPIRMKEISVLEYFNLLQEFDRYNKETEKINKQNGKKN